MATLEEVFKSFCAFGADKDTVPLMDNAKFSKLFRDLKLLDKKITANNVDIVFAKVKAKSERKITFEQFDEALKLCAEIKYPGDAAGYQKLQEKATQGKGPVTDGTTKAEASGAVGRLTDTSKYTGSHKERFDESGKGKGMAGRKEDDDDQAGYVGGYKNKDTYNKS